MATLDTNTTTVPELLDEVILKIRHEYLVRFEQGASDFAAVILDLQKIKAFYLTYLAEGKKSE